LVQEEDDFSRKIASSEALVGTPTLFESRLVLASKMDRPDAFMERFIQPPAIHPVAFTLQMYQIAVEAFDRFGCGRGHPAKLNFGDCMAYAVAKAHDVPLLYKGDDFGQTDIPSALP
jgi:ribonuclease VapC